MERRVLRRIRPGDSGCQPVEGSSEAKDGGVPGLVLSSFLSTHASRSFNLRLSEISVDTLDRCACRLIID